MNRIVKITLTFLGILLSTACSNINQANTESTSLTTRAQENTFALYFVRHAEKAPNYKDPKNPPLTRCGQQRAKELATLFKHIDIKSIYSTNYLRTQLTAKAIANAINIDVTLYNPFNLKAFYQQLEQKQQTSLIVGHSNTTSKLAGMFVDKSLNKIPEDIYSRIYQVTINKGIAQLQLIEQPFRCEE